MVQDRDQCFQDNNLHQKISSEKGLVGFLFGIFLSRLNKIRENQSVYTWTSSKCNSQKICIVVDKIVHAQVVKILLDGPQINPSYITQVK